MPTSSHEKGDGFKVTIQPVPGSQGFLVHVTRECDDLMWIDVAEHISLIESVTERIKRDLTTYCPLKGDNEDV